MRPYNKSNLICKSILEYVCASIDKSYSNAEHLWCIRVHITPPKKKVSNPCSLSTQTDPYLTYPHFALDVKPNGCIHKLPSIWDHKVSFHKSWTSKIIHHWAWFQITKECWKAMVLVPNLLIIVPSFLWILVSDFCMIQKCPHVTWWVSKQPDCLLKLIFGFAFSNHHYYQISTSDF